MELRHLRYFVAVAKELSFTRAADRLHMAQPPLSQQIRQLEDELGAQLFSRTRRRVELTEAGQAVLAQTRRALAEAESVVRVARRFVAGEMGDLKVGFSSSAAYAIMPAILRTFRTRFPEVSLILEECSTEEQIASLAVHQLDVGFVRLPVENAPAALIFKTIVREPLILALPHKHRLGRRHTLPLTALAKEPFVVVARQSGPGMHDQIEMLCRRAGFKPEVAQQAMEIQTIVGLVSAGLGIAIVPALVRGLQGGRADRPLAPASAFTETALAYNRENRLAVVDSFLDVVAGFTQRRQL